MAEGLTNSAKKQCMFCDGFCGNVGGAGSPVCRICHAFMFSNNHQHVEQAAKFQGSGGLPNPDSASSSSSSSSDNEDENENSDSSSSSSSSDHEGDSGNEAGPAPQPPAPAPPPPAPPPPELNPLPPPVPQAANQQAGCKQSNFDVNEVYSTELLPSGGCDVSYFDRLPIEIIYEVMGYFNDIDLWMFSHVCTRFMRIVLNETSGEFWLQKLLHRWNGVVLHPTVELSLSGYEIYSLFMYSLNCFRCFFNIFEQVSSVQLVKAVIAATNPTDQQIVPRRLWRRRIDQRERRLERELHHIAPCREFGVKRVDENGSTLIAYLHGAAETPYFGGRFYLLISISHIHPFAPPIIRFLTKVFHPNVSRHGDIGVDMLRCDSWSASLCLWSILISLQSVLNEPNTQIVMDRRISDLYVSNRPKFNRIAQHWTQKYAMLDYICDESRLALIRAVRDSAFC